MPESSYIHNMCEKQTKCLHFQWLRAPERPRERERERERGRRRPREGGAERTGWGPKTLENVVFFVKKHCQNEGFG